MLNSLTDIRNINTRKTITRSQFSRYRDAFSVRFNDNVEETTDIAPHMRPGFTVLGRVTREMFTGTNAATCGRLPIELRGFLRHIQARDPMCEQTAVAPWCPWRACRVGRAAWTNRQPPRDRR